MSQITTQGNSSKVDEMLRKQKSNFKAFLRTIDAVDLETMSERWEFDDVLKIIQSRWSVIDSLHWEIDSESVVDNDEYDRAFSEYEKKYNDVKRAVNSKMWSVSYKEKTTPKMDIPMFHGNYQQWISFKDLFCETIHNNKSLPNAQKMQFLKAKLRGEADKLIQHLRISSDNYQVCWDILNHRYQNMRLIFNSHIQTLLTMPNMSHQTAPLIKKLHDTTNECLNAIKAMEVDITNWDPLIVYILAQKLDAETHHDYIESLRNPRDLPTIVEFLEFLETKFTSLESSRRKQDSAKPNIQHSQQNYNQKGNNMYNKSPNNSANKNYQHRPTINHAMTKPTNIAQQRKCILCSNNHALFQCKIFLESVPENRRMIIENNKLCKNCLINHSGRACSSEKTCRFCNDTHNTLLHNAYVTYAESTSSLNKDENDRKSNVCVSNGPSVTIPKLLATAKVNIKSVDGCYHTMRALIDPCAESSLITENAAQLLGLPRIKRNCVVVGVGAKANNSKGVIKITISSLYNNFTLNTEAYVMKHVVGNLPNQSFAKPSWSHLDKVPLADPEFNRSRPVDLILSVEVYELIILPGFIRNDTSQAVAQQTEFGWILSGTVRPQSYCNVVRVDLNNIQRFWEIEDISDDTLKISSEDDLCIQHYQLTTKRQPDGRYVVRLPLKPDVTEKLGESRTKAAAQFRQLEKRFIRNKTIAESYKQFIHEYKELGHMTKCAGNQTPESYLPHHCVLRAESMTTATRVVFNASAKTSTGYSLNDLMYSGPNLQKDLLSLIISWRQYQIAFTGDIEKMFRQILIHKEDQALQKIIWRDHPKQALQEYQLTTVTYGTKSAPFLAMMTLKQLAKDEGHHFGEAREAAEAVENNFYMDDLLLGHEDLQSAKKLKKDLIALLSRGGFNLRKWSSNKPDLLEEHNLYDQTYNFKDQESTRALGLQWRPREDYFTFQLKIESPTKITKRALLSAISKIFDPLGWLSPVTTKLKLLFQEIWLLNLQWDDVLPDSITSKWNTMKADIDNINHVRVPRWLQCNKNSTIELHGYCDASEKAYACVIYCKINRSEHKQPSVVIVAAKSRLVPKKKAISLPRLELCATVLLARLMKTACQCLDKFTIKRFGWSDSTAVLGWLNGEPSRWKPFVANRVKEVIEVIPPSSWNYVPSKENPADCGSRGITAEQLIKHPIWWHGPNWLLSFDENIAKKTTYHTNEEVRKSVSINMSTINHNNEVIDSILSRFSDITRACRVLAWALRMRLRNKHTYLTIPEIRNAKNILIRSVQSEIFSDDISYIKKHNQPNPKSSLLKLHPFLDDQGILRVGGRLEKANIQTNMKHPSILPHNHPLTDMIIDQAHRMTFHGGARLTLAWIRQQHWIIGGNNAVKKRLRRCIVCRRNSPLKHNQLMGNLPAARTNITRPFHHTGVDFTGFVDVKSAKGRGVRCTKGYIAVFVCMATKAIHLELVSDLTSSAFTAALRRFAARRGAPGHMYSDNGTNFVKTNRLLQEEIINLKSILDDQFYVELTEMQIEWHFNAPSWPSAGGLWEAAVKSLKYHMKRVIGEQRLTYEEFATLLAQVEGCLNSRPLCPLSEDVDDLAFLTPAHFLSGGPTVTIVETEKDLRTRWQLTQKIYQDIWKRWRTEYLAQLNTRSKWQRPQPNLELGDIVIIHDVNLPPGKWALCRVVELHPGKDGLVRVVSVKTKNGVIKRPLVKLSLLPVNDETNRNQENLISNTNSPSKDSQTPKTKPKGRSTRGIYHFMTMLLMLFTCLISPIQCTHNIVNLNDSHGLYFDRMSTVHFVRDEWKLVVYYDVEPYWQGVNLLQKYINHLGATCATLDEKVHCESVLLQLRHSYDELKRYNNLFASQQFPGGHARRRRRGLINAVGNIAHSLFGVLDDQFAEQYKRDIDLVRSNQNHLASLWKNQTSVVEAEYNVLNRMKISLDKQHKIFNQYINQLRKDENMLKNQIVGIKTTNEFLMSSIVANTLLTNLKGIQDVLLDTISEVNYGRFNIHLLKPDQLLEELNVISGKLSKELSLPIDNIPSELPKIYHLLKVRARMTQTYLIFEMRIPLVSRDNYEVYKILSVPKRIRNNMVTLVPVSDYVAINLRKDSYITITQPELQECIHFDLTTQLCPAEKPILRMKPNENLCFKNLETQVCKTRSEPCQDSWIQLKDMNTILFFCCETRQIRILCDDQVTSNQVFGAGLITLGNDCMIKGKDITIIARKRQYNNLTTSVDLERVEIPQINHILNQNLMPITEPEPIMDVKELKEIGNSIREMKTETGIASGISYHDVHHYVFIYLLVGAAAATAAGYGVRRWRARRAPPAVEPPRDVAALERPTPRDCPTSSGVTNAAFHYSVQDECVSANVVQGDVKPVPSVRVSESTSPMFQKHSFREP